MNVVALNWLKDEQAIEWIYYLDENGNEIQFKNNPKLMKKLTVMGVGEVLADSDDFGL